MRYKEQYFIAAGEHSGDILAADLVHAINEFLPGHHGFGITGKNLELAGVEQVLSIDELSVMGFAEVAARLGSLRMAEMKVLQTIDRLNPKFTILVDNPGFNMRLAEQIHLRGIPVIQYIAPKLWASRIGRMQKLQRDFDMVLGILPFEEDFFIGHGVHYKYVGSPHLDRSKKIIINQQSLGIPANKTIIAFLPGSRKDELMRLMPTMIAVKNRIQQKLPDSIFIMPLATVLNYEDVRKSLKPCYPVVPKITDSDIAEGIQVDGLHVVRGMSLEIMSCADVALVASGTATLECALQQTPMIVVYKMSSFTYEIAKKIVKLPYVSLVNLIAGKLVVKEYIQNFSNDEIASEMISLLEDEGKRHQMQKDLSQATAGLRGDAARCAAHEIASYLKSHTFKKLDQSLYI